MATVNELITALGFELKPDALKKVQAIDKALGGLVSAAKKISLSFIGTKSVLDWMTGTVAKESQELLNLAESTNISAETWQRWKYAAEASGQSSNTFVSDLEKLRKQTFRTEEGFYELSDRLSGMTWREATQWGERLGISDDTLRVMRKGSKEIKRLMGEAIVIPTEKLKQGENLNKNIGKLKNNIEQLKLEIGTGLAPILDKTVGKMNDWIQANHEIIEQKIEDLVKGINKGFENFYKIIEPVVEKVWDLAKYIFDITDSEDEIEKIADIVTGALLLITGEKVLTGLTIMVNQFKALKATLTDIVVPIAAIASGYDMIVKGVETLRTGKQTDNWFEKKADEWVVRPMMKAMGIQEGALSSYLTMADQGISMANSLPRGTTKVDSHDQITIHVQTPLTKEGIKEYAKSLGADLAGAYGGYFQ